METRRSRKSANPMESLRRSRKSINPMESFHLPRSSDVGADYSVNVEQLKVLQDLSVAARESLMPSPSVQPIIPDDSNVSSGELKSKFPDDTQWFKRLDKTFRASATPRPRNSLRRQLSENVSSSDVVSDEESLMPAPKGRKLFKKKKLFTYSGEFEKVLDDTALTDEPSVSNETSRNSSDVSGALRRSSRLGKSANAAVSEASPRESPRHSFRKVGRGNRLSEAIQGVRMSLAPTINETSESAVSHQEPSASKASPSPPRRNRRTWTKSRRSNRDLMDDEEDDESAADETSFVPPPRPKLFGGRATRVSFGAVLDEASLSDGTATSPRKTAKSGSRTPAAENSVVERRKPFANKASRNRRESAFGHILDAEESVEEASKTAETATENPDASEESVSLEERSVGRKPFGKTRQKDRSSVFADVSKDDSAIDSEVVGDQSTAKLSGKNVSICECASPGPLQSPPSVASEKRTDAAASGSDDSEEDQPSPPPERRSLFARKTRRSSAVAPAIAAEDSEVSQEGAGAADPNPEESEEDPPSPPPEKRTPFARKSRRSSAVAPAIAAEDSEVSQEGAEAADPNPEESEEDLPSPPPEKRTPFSRKSRRSSAVGPAVAAEDSEVSQESAGAADPNPEESEEDPPSPPPEKRTLLARKSHRASVVPAMDTEQDSVKEASLSSPKRRSQSTKSPARANNSDPGPDEEPSVIETARTKRWADKRRGNGVNRFDGVLSDDSSSNESTAAVDAAASAEDGQPKQAEEEAPQGDEFVAPLNVRRSVGTRSAARKSLRVVLPHLASNAVTSTPTPSATKMVVPSPISAIRSPSKDSPLDRALAQSPAKNTRSQTSGLARPPEKSDNSREEDLPPTAERKGSAKRTSTSGNRRSSRKEEQSSEEEDVRETSSKRRSAKNRQSSRHEEQSSKEEDVLETASKRRSEKNRRSSRKEEEQSSGEEDVRETSSKGRSEKNRRSYRHEEQSSKEEDVLETASKRRSEKNRRSSRKEEQSSGEEDVRETSSEGRSEKNRRSSRHDEQSSKEENVLETASKGRSEKNRRSSRKEELPLEEADDGSLDDETLPSSIERDLPWDRKSPLERTSEKERRSRGEVPRSGSPASSAKEAILSLSPNSVASEEMKRRSGRRTDTAPRQALSSLKAKKSASQSIFGDVLDASSESEEQDDESPSPAKKRKSPTVDGPRKKSRANEAADQILGNEASENTGSAISLNPTDDFMTMVSETARGLTMNSDIRISRRSPATVEDVRTLLNTLEDGSLHDSGSHHSHVSGGQDTPEETLENSTSRKRKSVASAASSLKRKTPEKRSRHSDLSEDQGSDVSEDLGTPEQTQEKSPSRRRKSVLLAAAASSAGSLKRKSNLSNVSEDLGMIDQAVEGNSTQESGRESASTSSSVEDNTQPSAEDPGTPEESVENSPPNSARVPASSLKKKTPQNSGRRSNVPELPSQRAKTVIPDRVRNADIRSFFQKSTPVRERQPDDTPESLVPLDATRLTPITKTTGFNGGSLMSTGDSLALGDRGTPQTRTSDKLSVVNIQNILNKLRERDPPKTAPQKQAERVPAKPAQPKRSPAKPTLKPAGKKFQLILPDGKAYKAPKLLKPQKFATDKMYRFITKRIKNNSNLDTRVRSEQFVQRLCDTYTKVIRKKKSKALVNDLLEDMVQLGLVSTYSEFYSFVEDFMPYSFRIKAIPCVGKDLAPKPTKGIHEKLA